MSPRVRDYPLDDALPANARLGAAPGLQLSRIASAGDWSRVRALRYAALRSRGEIPESAAEAFEDSFDAALNSATFQLARSGRTVGSTRSSIRSARHRWPLPSTQVFGAEIEAAVGPDATLVEASLTVADPYAIDAKVALFHLFKAHMLQCAAEDADWLIVAVRDLQMGFYRRMFNMETLTRASPVAGFATPRIVMGLEYRAQSPLLFKRLPVLAVSESEEREYALSGLIAPR